jgi:hypothetical protein
MEAEFPLDAWVTLVLSYLLVCYTVGSLEETALLDLENVGYCSGYYEARSMSGRASGKKYKAQIVIFCILLAVNRFSWISWKAKSC